MLSKRTRFALSSLGSLLLLGTLALLRVGFLLNFVASLFCGFLSLWALGIKPAFSLKTFSSLLPPFFLPLSMASISLFYPLTPWVRALFWLALGFFLYLILLAQNIFLVSRAGRRVPLIRAARATLTLATSISAFFALWAIYKGARLPWQWILVFLFALPSFWSFFFWIRPHVTSGRRILRTTLLSSFLFWEGIASLSFFPLSTSLRAIYSGILFHFLLSLGRARLSHRPLSHLFLEHIFLFLLVALASLYV